MYAIRYSPNIQNDIHSVIDALDGASELSDDELARYYAQVDDLRCRAADRAAVTLNAADLALSEAADHVFAALWCLRGQGGVQADAVLAASYLRRAHLVIAPR